MYEANMNNLIETLFLWPLLIIYPLKPLQVLIGISFSWLICYILTVYDVLPTNPKDYGYMARTDLKGDVISQAPWFTFPYPGKEKEKVLKQLKVKMLEKEMENILFKPCPFCDQTQVSGGCRQST